MAGPQQANLPQIASINDIVTPFIATPAVEVTTSITTIRQNFSDVGAGPQRPPAFRLDELDRKPRTRAQIAPVYPFDAKRDGRAGTVHVEFTVDENGRVSEPRIVETTDRVFNEATLAAVLKWRFEPGPHHEKAVRFRMIAPVVVSLND